MGGVDLGAGALAGAGAGAGALAGQLVLARDLPALGLTRRRVERLSREGWLREVRRGVLLVGGGRPSEWQEVVAAAMVAGPCGAVSHSTAARIHRFAGVAGSRVGAVAGAGATAGTAAAAGALGAVELTVPVRANPRLAGCILHRVRDLDEKDVVMWREVRVTTPTRTLIDMAPRLPVAVIEKTVDEGLIARLWDEADLVAAVAGAGGRPGVGKLRRVMAPRSGASGVDSHLEQTVTRALRSLGPFETGYEVIVEGRLYILDIAWPAYKVAAECDGWTVRGRSRSKFDHDRRKDNDLASQGWIVVHLTSAMSEDEMRTAVVRVLLKAAAAGPR